MLAGRYGGLTAASERTQSRTPLIDLGESQGALVERSVNQFGLISRNKRYSMSP
jgi:hypothetical protein